MRRFLYLLALFSVSVCAADFRAIDISQSCDTVQDWELTHGSILIPSHADSGAKVYAFTTDEFDEHIVVTYLCKNGTLFTGDREFPVESWSKAVESYQKLYDSLLLTYGAPTVKGRPFDDNSDQQKIAADWINHMTVWKTARGNVMLTIQPSPPSPLRKPESPLWHVSIAVGK